MAGADTLELGIRPSRQGVSVFLEAVPRARGAPACMKIVSAEAAGDLWRRAIVPGAFHERQLLNRFNEVLCEGIGVAG